MSSPYSRETKRGTEESIEAMERARTWLSRIDTRNDATNLELGSIDDDLSSEIERLEKQQKISVTELAVDNFVFNNHERVEAVLTGDLDEKSNAIRDVKDSITEQFGRVTAPSLSKENVLWLVAQEVQSKHINGVTDYYDHLSNLDFESMGKCPDMWGGEYPIHN